MQHPDALVVTLKMDHPTSAGRSGAVDLRVGQAAWLGACACGRCDFDLVVATTTWTPLAVKVEARIDHWTISNVGGQGVLRCHDLEDQRQQVLVPPGRTEAVIPFELTVIEFTDWVGSERVLAFGPEPPKESASPARTACPATASAPRLRLDSAYYAVLEELCRAWRSAGEGSRLPTSAQVADRLNRRGLRLTRRAVDHHVEHLVDRLGLRERIPEKAQRGRREALVREALRLNLLAPGAGAWHPQSRGPAPGTG